MWLVCGPYGALTNNHTHQIVHTGAGLNWFKLVQGKARGVAIRVKVAWHSGVVVVWGQGMVDTVYHTGRLAGNWKLRTL